MKATRAPKKDSGFSAVELLVFTAPLCLLALVITGKLAATGSAHIRAGWQASLAAQRDSRAPCGGSPELDAPWHPETDPAIATRMTNRMAHLALSPATHKLTEIQETENRLRQGIGPLTQQEARAREAAEGLSNIATAVNYILASVNFAVEQLADLSEDVLTSPELGETNFATRTTSAVITPYYFQASADRLLGGPAAVSASATFVCNEPDGGDSRREKKRGQLIGFATEQAEGIFF